MPRRPLDALDKRIIGLAVPALGTLTIEPLYNLTDTAIVGHLGRVPLGGLAIATSVLNILGWSANWLSTATTSRVAFQDGRRDPDGVASAAAAAYWSALAIGALVAVVLVAAARPLATLLGARGDVLDAATTYLRIAAIGMPFLLVTFAGNGHLRGLSNTRTPFRITVAANVVNVALELALVYGLGFGIAGSAAGTVVAQAVSAACFVVVGARPVARVRLRPHRADTRALWNAGAVLVIRTLALGAALNAATAIAAHLGTTVVGGHQIALQFWLLLALTLDALAVPAQVYVGNALGAGDVARAVEVGRRCLRLGWLLGGLLAVVTMATAPVLPYAFTGDASVRSQASAALLMCGVGQPLAAAAFVFDGLFLGAGGYAILRRTMLLALGVFAAPAALTLAVPSLGVAGVWFALDCWLGARAAMLGRRWASGAWQPRSAAPVMAG
jgi:putative MATE family efflux protein